MNMKFMQRAQSKDSPATPQSDPDKRSAKRQKLNETHSPSGVESDASFPPTPTSVDLARDKLLADQAEEAGDTKWTLDGPEYKAPATSGSALRIRIAGYGAIDSGAHTSSGDEEGGARQEARGGRRAFGPPRRVQEVCFPILLMSM